MLWEKQVIIHVAFGCLKICKMTLSTFNHKFITELNGLYPKNEIDSFFKLLLEHQLHFSSVDIALKSNTNIDQNDLDFLLKACAELKQEKPIQYILGETEFYGLPFKVTKNTLIPRPETEELVDWIVQEIKEKSEKRKDTELNILDIGTGSGCIAISLAKHLPKATVHALDISKDALAIAKQNAELNNVTVQFIEQDMLDSNVMLSLSKHLSESNQFDIIVSNPPYVRNLEKKEINNNVLQHEPHNALFVPDNNPLIFYDRIADFAKEKLSKNGQLFFEINQYLSIETEHLLRKKGYTTIEVKKDLFTNYRMIKAAV